MIKFAYIHVFKLMAKLLSGEGVNLKTAILIAANLSV